MDTKFGFGKAVDLGFEEAIAVPVFVSFSLSQCVCLIYVFIFRVFVFFSSFLSVFHSFEVHISLAPPQKKIHKFSL